ncbi:ATP-binding protein [Actinoplanes sp. NBRC 103695]|uniref:ATP-binding protein n=1 Tax=Actinoplanes sp. NBRC 103695 TaxID=3032202 RepID=UPI0024A4E53F|nr:ATP-binding protein [Actinoplanes sp. NBRC 103695]GLY99836.1 hypothetical protein Acsp02_70890 [Actinoplanes sp. NBRC 103695]
MSDESSQSTTEGDHLGWGELGRLPVDGGNPAPKVRAWFQFQDDCAALVLLGHLADDALAGVVIERATDLILIRTDGDPELVSIKHREPNRGGSVAWTWSALEQDRVLSDLHAKWLLYGKRATLAFWSNAGFAGGTHELWRVCAKGETPTAEMVDHVARQLAVPAAEAHAFLAAFHLPEEPLPRRKEMEDVAVRRTADLLRPLRDGTDATAAACFEALRTRIREAATDTPGRTTERAAAAATLADAGRLREQLRIRHEFISRDETLSLLLATHDRLAAQPPHAAAPRWVVDPLFAGRDTELATLAEVLRPGSPDEVTPVLVHGMPGAGKTSLAMQFAGLHGESLRPELISGTSRLSVQRALHRLQTVLTAPEDDTAEEQIAGRLALPRDPSLLLIIDGVTDVATVAGLIPRSTLCRVVITSTVRHIDHGYHSIELLSWTPEVTAQFIRGALPRSTPAEVASLGAALGHHPLAVSQAVNYCLASDRPIAGFLVQLGRQPDVALQRGTTADHPTGLVPAIELQLQLLRQQNATAGDLLMLLAHLALAPVNEQLLRNANTHALTVTPYVRPLHSSVWRRLKAIVTGQPVVKAHVLTEVTRRAREISDKLADPSAGETAVDLLVERSLIRRAGPDLMLHPLIGTVLRSQETDPLTWIELGLGLFLDKVDPNDPFGAVAELDAAMDHITALVLLALDHHHFGPAVTAAAMLLCLHLATRSGIPPLDTIDAAADFAARTLAITDDLASQGLLDVRLIVQYRRAASALLQRAGRVDEAITQISKVRTLAATLDAESDVIRGLALSAVLDLGAIAVNATRRDLAQEVLAALEQAGTEGRDVRASMGHIRAGLLRLLGRIDEAADVNAAALASAEVEGPVAPRLLADLHTSAATIARDQRDTHARLRHEQAALEQFRTLSGTRVSLRVTDALTTTADAAVETLQLDLAAELLTETEQAIRATFGINSVPYAKYLTTRGHLNLIRCRWLDAVDDLQTAIALLRHGDENSRGYLPSALVLLGQAAALLDDAGTANAAFDEAIATDTSLFGPDHPETQADIAIKNRTPGLVSMQRQVAQLPFVNTSNAASWAGPDFEPMSGRIAMGNGPYGSIITWQLHRPGEHVRHGLIDGPPHSGRSTLMRKILLRAAATGLYTIMPMGMTWSRRDRKAWGRNPNAAAGLDNIENRLTTVTQQCEERAQATSSFHPSPARQGILIGIDDADSLLHAAPALLPLLEKVVTEGPAAGIAIVLVTADATPRSFGDSSVLNNGILAGNHLAPKMLSRSFPS